MDYNTIVVLSSDYTKNELVSMGVGIYVLVAVAVGVIAFGIIYKGK